ncbi:hypothetical protein F5Y19DRAFT_461644 [Xylariaceae sp. FL1651]|nr:hypothetical protein F5Y19DRAFT_461644 [Xylariaceae sp. FL1651]
MADTDSEPEHGSFEGSPLPQTPTRDAHPEPHPHHKDGDVSTPHSSLLPSPSMSLYSVGMSPLSPLRRQFSPPMARSSPSYPQSDLNESENEDISLDSKDVLVQRLNDLAARLSQQHHVKGHNVNVLHAKVDEMENVLYTHGYPLKTKTQSPRTLTWNAEDEGGSDLSWEAGQHPPNPLLSDISSLSSPKRISSSAKTRMENQSDAQAGSAHASKMTVAQAERVIAEAQALHKGLEMVIANLRARQEETEHIHELLITRAERAAQRIIFLEERLQELESERNEGETEMLNLQIQLKAIEVQCLSYVPKDADEDLRESIATWKMEWSALKRRRAQKREQLTGTPGTPTRRRMAHTG